MYLRNGLRETPSSLTASPTLLCPWTAGKIWAKRRFRPLRSITLGLPALLPWRLAPSIPAITRKARSSLNTMAA